MQRVIIGAAGEVDYGNVKFSKSLGGFYTIDLAGQIDVQDGDIRDGMFDELEGGFTAVKGLSDLEASSGHHLTEVLHKQRVIFNYKDMWHFSSHAMRVPEKGKILCNP